MSESAKMSQELLSLIDAKLGKTVLNRSLSLGDAVIRVSRDHILDLCRILKLDKDLGFNYLIDITVVDWMDQQEERFEVVYHFMSFPRGYRLRVKVWVPENKPEVPSVVSLWSGADFMEREAWDMYGVTFTGHPNLKRILMYDEFKGHPLRKDYPVQAKQPRIPLRFPEVRNTAVDMKRPELVQINRKKNLEAHP